MAIVSWFVYIVQGRDLSYYTGVTTDPKRRVKQHNGVIGGGAKYTRSVRPVKIVFTIEVGDRAEAQRIESQIKKFSRQEKIDLINCT